MNEEYMTIGDFAAEVGVSQSTVYRWLKLVPSMRTKMLNGRKHHADSTLYEALRRSKMLGVRDIQGKFGVALRDLKPAGFPGYAVSALGRVYSTDKNTRRVKTRKRASDGYHIVDLGDYGTQYVHRLVAAAFLGLPYTKIQQVDHLDGNKSNNKAENLDWVSPGENLARRNKRLFSNPHRPNKYTRTELGCLRSAFLRGLKYKEFCGLHQNLEISGTHYRRLNKDCPAIDHPLVWEGVETEKRFVITSGILRYKSYFSVFDYTAHHLSYGQPMTPEEFVMISSWIDFYDIRADLANFIKDAVRYHNQTGKYENYNLDRLHVQVSIYSNRLRHMVKFPYFYNKTIDMWWLRPIEDTLEIEDALAIAGEPPWEFKGFSPTIRTPEVIEMSRLGLFE